MKIAYLDTIAGISGDMTVAAFLNAGVPFEYLKTELEKLNLSGYEISCKEIKRNGITATKFDVEVHEIEHIHRHLKDIKQIINDSKLSDNVKEISRKIFLELAKAEATVHKSSIENVHFHEVGAIDSIVDIVGASICMEYLKIEKVYSSPIKLGSGGFVKSQHGNLPIPVPAVVELLKNYPVTLTEIEFELTTPTGAAIVKALSSGVLKQEDFIIESIGYGAGSRELQIPNLLRVLIGKIEIMPLQEKVLLLETNIDDMNPEIYPYLIENLIAIGANDAYITPIIMKKGRPGILLSVLSPEPLLGKISEFVFKETTTLGLRIIEVKRKKVDREIKVIETKFGKVQIKAVFIDGKERLIPEYEECKRIAKERGIPLIEVYKLIEKELRG